MIKKVAVLLMSLIFLVSIIFYGNVFEFKLDEIQSLVFKAIFSYLWNLNYYVFFGW
jgi:hypothetical protein